MMAQNFYQRHTLVEDGLDWAVFMWPDGNIQLDLGRAGLVLPEGAFRRVCDFVLMLSTLPHGAVSSLSEPYRVLSYCPQADIVALGIDQTVLRFRPHEFARLRRLCRQTLEILGPARGMGMPLLPHISHN
jgi:hypothetical protein